jgi:hypothetical protein
MRSIWSVPILIVRVHWLKVSRIARSGVLLRRRRLLNKTQREVFARESYKAGSTPSKEDEGDRKQATHPPLEALGPMKRGYITPLFFFACLTATLAHAQAGSLDIGMGFGTAQASSAGVGLDYTNLSNCSAATNSYCSTNSKGLAGVTMGFHGNYMLTNRYGVGAEIGFQPAKQDYVSFDSISTGEYIKSRMTFYDFNGIARPLRNKYSALQFEGGFGGANLKFYDVLTSASTLGSGASTQYLSSANHFQLHAGVSVPIYLKHNIFVRPEFDVHYVPGLTDQYGSNTVTQAMVWVGYSFGRR